MRSLIRFTLTTALLASTASAEIIDFGGHDEKFKGGGDKIPPQCSINIPKASAEPFFIKWYCIDDNAGSQDIRTELWMFRKDSPASELVGNFLGFPAAALIDAPALHVTEFSEGFPVSFRLVAIDRAGIEAISPVLTVGAQDNSLDSCTLTVATEATAASGSTTGLPAMNVTLSNVAVEIEDTSEQSKLRITTKESTLASPCEVESICSDDSKVGFDITVTFGEDKTGTGTMAITPGATQVELTGTASVEGVTLNSLDLTGETTIDGAQATVTLECKQ